MKRKRVHKAVVMDVPGWPPGVIEIMCLETGEWCWEWPSENNRARGGRRRIAAGLRRLGQLKAITDGYVGCDARHEHA